MPARPTDQMPGAHNGTGAHAERAPVRFFYRNQGVENSGYVTAPFLRRLAHATPGLDAQRPLTQRRSPQVARLLAKLGVRPAGSR